MATEGPPGDRPFIVVGAGLVGSMMAALLGRRGHRVELLERRSDPRSGAAQAARSINLAISARGLNALARLDLDDQVLARAVPLFGRMVHSTAGQQVFQPYGVAGQAIHSFSRAELNLALFRAAAASPNVTARFDRRAVDVDLAAGTVSHVNAATGAGTETSTGTVIGADGAYSVVRAAMQRREHHDYAQRYLAHGYKELTIPPGPDGGPRLRRDALHIWPRGGFMMMAMANHDSSFTVTLYLPMTGPNGFASLARPGAATPFFEREFRDAIPLIPDLAQTFAANPTGSMVTIRTWPWQVGGRAVLAGDAAHAIVPFYGQGANAGFEDCLALLDAIDAAPGDPEGAFERYQRERKPNAEAIADLAVVNFHEMRDQVGSPAFRLRKRVEKLLHRLAPRWYVPLYSMVSFSLMPYAVARARARRQTEGLRWLAAGVVLALLAALTLTLT